MLESNYIFRLLNLPVFFSHNDIILITAIHAV